MPYSKRAFTLIELIMVMLIAVILAAIAMSPKSTLQQVRINDAARKIKSDLRYAQNYAVATQNRTRIVFSSTGYSVYAESGGSWNLIKDPLKRTDFVVDFSQGEYAGVTITQTDFGGIGFGLVFDAGGLPYGWNPAGGSVSLLSSQGSVTLTGGTTVTVEPNTGRVQ